MPRSKKPTPPDNLPPGLTPELLELAKRYLASQAGRAGKGKAKARTPEQARAAVEARWAKAKKKKPI
jgi:hypothetical protein